jgi:hypothetical protein
MKKPKTKTAVSDDHSNHAVNYQWTGHDGIICRSHTVSAGRNQADAEKRFFAQNPHVTADRQDTTDYAFD